MIELTVMRGSRERVRVLEDDLHPAPQAAELVLVELRTDPAPSNRTVPGGWLAQPDHGAPGGALAAARLAHQAERLAAPDLEA